MKKFLFAWLGVFSALVFSGRAVAAELHVDLNSTNAVPPFSSWATAATNIQNAVDVAVNGDTVLVTNGHYLLSSEILVTNNITIQSVNGADATIVDGGGSNRCFNLGNSACLISGFTITNGYVAGAGGGIYCSSTTPIVSDCVISGNLAYGGGGIFRGTANNCLFSRNSAVNNLDQYDTGCGGGMYGGIANHCVFVGNLAKSNVGGYHGTGCGGGMYERDFGGVANNCTFIGNTAASKGGAVFAYFSDGITISNCVLSGNSAISGGGMYYGVANNCTISGNSALQTGGGMYEGQRSAANNCIIWGNVADWHDDLHSNYAQGIVAHHTCSPDVENGVDGNVTNAPLLVSASHIAVDSPCRGMGSSQYSSGTDIDGEPWQNPPSMGCDEVHETVSGTIRLSVDGPADIRAGIAGKYFVNIQGAVTGSLLIFGDGVIATNAILVSHVWDAPGVYEMVLTAFNDDYPNGFSSTQEVRVVSAEENAIYISDSAGNNSYDGKSWATAKKTIQNGVDAQTVHGGIVWVSNGVYSVSSEITVEKNVQIRSVNGPDVTIVDGGGSNRCFNLNEEASLVSGFTITNGYASYAGGGGIYCAGIAATVSNCTIIGNLVDKHTANGGGIYSGTANNCTITGNSASSYGGGIYRGSANNCTIADNSARYGGGTYYGTANSCIISENRAQSYGGGAFGGTANNCTITGNSAASGGGTYYGTANSCMISSNSAGSGGGICRGSANNCTIIANSASDSGGGVFAYSHDSSLAVSSCIIWSNTAGNLDGIKAHHSCSPDLVPGVDGNITNAPLFVDFMGSDYHLQSNSPCINWGNNTTVSGGTDLDGNPRIVENTVDMGCYEYQGILGLTDSDNDGLLDDWERQWFGGNVLPEDNPDADVSSNESEFIAGTDPTNAASYFQATAATAEVGGKAHFVIEWTAATGRVYNVYWKPSLTDEFQPLETGIAYPQHSYTDTVHSAESSGFYRVVVMRADYDADGDGLPNDWEEQYAVAEASADNDDDGFDNLSEFIAGTDPTNGTSYFSTMNSVAEIDGTNCFVVEWISIPDRLYSVQWSTNLVAGFQTLESGIEYPQHSYTDTLHNAESDGFYKVDVELE